MEEANLKLDKDTFIDAANKLLSSLNITERNKILLKHQKEKWKS